MTLPSLPWPAAWQAVATVGAGHAAAIALVAAAAVPGLAKGRSAVFASAGALLLAALLARLARRGLPSRGAAGRAELALGSFLASSAHGAGLALVPALAPWCGSGSGPTHGYGPLAGALAGIAVHATAMLAATGLVAAGAAVVAGRLQRHGNGIALR